MQKCSFDELVDWMAIWGQMADKGHKGLEEVDKAPLALNDLIMARNEAMMWPNDAPWPEVAAICKTKGLLVESFNSGHVADSYSYIGFFIDKDTYLSNAAKVTVSDVLKVYVCDAANELKLKDIDRQPIVIRKDTDNGYINVMMLRWPLMAISKLPMAIADEIMAKYIFVQFAYHVKGPKDRAILAALHQLLIN
jgi:hypothetical protein